MDLGFSRVAALLGGYNAWLDAGFPVESDDTTQASPEY
jgi:3-mercaptopyruvate sulfurtransferase SseA